MLVPVYIYKWGLGQKATISPFTFGKLRKKHIFQMTEAPGIYIYIFNFFNIPNYIFTPQI